MMRKTSGYYDRRVFAFDDDIGRMSDFYLDGRSWQIRYLLVELNSEFKAKAVLVSPVALSSFDGERLKVELTKEEIRKYLESGLSTQGDGQYKEEIENLYGPLHQSDSFEGRFDTVLCQHFDSEVEGYAGGRNELLFRSVRELAAYEIITEDGNIGSAVDFLFDDRLWNVRFLIGSIKDNSGHEAKMIVTFFIDVIKTEEKAIYLGCRKSYLSRCLTFDPSVHINISYEEFLSRYNKAFRNAGRVLL